VSFRERKAIVARNDQGLVCLKANICRSRLPVLHNARQSSYTASQITMPALPAPVTRHSGGRQYPVFGHGLFRHSDMNTVELGQ